MRKTALTSTLVLVAAVALVACGPASAATVGEAAPAFTLNDLDGNQVSLADYEGQTVVLEWINPNCPVSLRHTDEKTMIDLVDEHENVVWLAINSTHPAHGNYLEPAEHKAFNAEKGIDYTVLYDPTGEVGQAYGARTTPHMYIVDGDGTLVYNGAIDDDPRGRTPKAERTNYVDGGVVAVAANRSVDPATTKPYGCSIKYN